MGSWRSKWGLILMIKVSKESLFVREKYRIKKKNFVTPIFQGPWSSIFGPRGFPGSNTSDLTLKNKYLTPQILNIWHIFTSNMLPSLKSRHGVQKRGPERTFLWWSEENSPQNVFLPNTFTDEIFNISQMDLIWVPTLG